MDKDISQSISYLRLPLALLIVFGHANILSFPICSHGEFAIYNLSIISYPISFFSLILFGSAVPLFFMVSGYLFFAKESSFNLHIYKIKIRKRFFSLLVPYLMWNVTYVLFNCFAEWSRGKEIEVLEQIRGVWAMKGSSFPADPVLWFVRDLIVCIILAPVLYYISRRRWVFSVLFVLLLSLWLTNSFQDRLLPGISISSMLFFSIGAFMGINNVDIKKYLISSGWWCSLIWISLIIIVLILKQNPDYSTGIFTDSIEMVVIYRLTNFIGCLVYMYLGTMASIYLNWRVGKVDHSFVIFAVHMLILMIIRKIVDLTIPMSISSLLAGLIYAVYVSAGFCGGWIISILIHKSKIAINLLAGGR